MSSSANPPNVPSNPTSPPTPAELRSQAVAKLKRAASLPRNQDGRRPSQNANGQEERAQGEAGTPAHTVLPSPYGAEEMLSPSPIAATFDHASLYASAVDPQRSASGSSSYHIPTPPQMSYNPSIGSPYTPSSGATDWAAMQLAQSYLSPPTSAPMPGRNTPSPLPTLGELRTLQRSNSAAARAHAMSKLTGSSVDEQGSSSRPQLQRADSLGTSRFVGMALARRQPAMPVEAPVERPVSRPRLERSFTVSGSNMGEERRSAVGRRMVERLATRKGSREKEEDEVRKLWEEKRVREAQDDVRHQDEGLEDKPVLGLQGARGRQDESLMPSLPRVEKSSPIEPPPVTEYPYGGGDLLAAPERSMSRGTMRSTQEPFEYESHLRRSLSSRTARDGVTTRATLTSGLAADAVEEVHPAPSPPSSKYATPTRPIHRETSTEITSHEEQTPGSVMSRDALGSMMFVMGRESANPVQRREGSWPMEVEDNSGSDWGTPAKDLHRERTLSN